MGGCSAWVDGYIGKNGRRGRSIETSPAPRRASCGVTRKEGAVRLSPKGGRTQNKIFPGACRSGGRGRVVGVAAGDVPHHARTLHEAKALVARRGGRARARNHTPPAAGESGMTDGGLFMAAEMGGGGRLPPAGGPRPCRRAEGAIHSCPPPTPPPLPMHRSQEDLTAVAAAVAGRGRLPPPGLPEGGCPFFFGRATLVALRRIAKGRCRSSAPSHPLFRGAAGGGGGRGDAGD